MFKDKDNEESFLAAESPRGGTSTECGPGNHHHSDQYSDHCHRISIKHRKKKEVVKKANPAKKNSPVKKLEVKKVK